MDFSFKTSWSSTKQSSLSSDWNETCFAMVCLKNYSWFGIINIITYWLTLPEVIIEENIFFKLNMYRSIDRWIWFFMTLHSDILFCFQANQSLLLLLNTVCLREETANTNFIIFGLTPQGWNPQSTAHQTILISLHHWRKFQLDLYSRKIWHEWFGFPIYRVWVYLMNVIPEKCHAH
jgi:hypothetical protein